MTQVLEATARLRDLRNRCLNGEDLTPEEYKEVLDSIRTMQRASSGGGRGKKEASPPVDSEALLNDLTF